MNNWTEHHQKFKIRQQDHKQIRRIQIVFFTSCIFAFLSCGVALYSIIHICRTVHGLYETTLDPGDLLANTSQHLNRMEDIASNMDEYTGLLIEEVHAFCPVVVPTTLTQTKTKTIPTSNLLQK